MANEVQWRRKCDANSSSRPQVHRRLSESWKLCLYFWEGKWLGLRQSLLRSLITSGLWRLWTLFADGLIKCKIEFLKTLQLSEFLILTLKSFHWLMVGGWKTLFHNKEKKTSYSPGIIWKTLVFGFLNLSWARISEVSICPSIHSSFWARLL